MGGILSKSSNPFAMMEGPDEVFLRGHCDSVFTVTHSPDGRRMASAGADRSIMIWDINRGKLRRTLVGHTAAINAIQYSPTGTVLVSGGDDRVILVWNPKKGTKTSEMPADRSRQSVGPINALAFSDDGRRLASAHGSPRDNDNAIRVWDIKKGEEVMRPLTGHVSVVTSVAYCDDFIASGSFDGMIKIWNARNGELKHSLRSQTGIVMSVAFSPDGMYVSAGEGCSSASTVRPSILRWETNRGVPAGVPMQGHTASIRSLAYSPDGTLLISGAEDGTVRTWKSHAKKYVGMVTGHLAVVSSVSVSPDQQFISSGSEDRTARLISLAYTPKARFFKKEKCMLCGCSRREHFDERLSCLPYITPHVIPDHQFNLQSEIAEPKTSNGDGDNDHDTQDSGKERSNSPGMDSEGIEQEKPSNSSEDKSSADKSPAGDSSVSAVFISDTTSESAKVPPFNRLVNFEGSEGETSEVSSVQRSKNTIIAATLAKKAFIKSRRKPRVSRDDIYDISSLDGNQKVSHSRPRDKQNDDQFSMDGAASEQSQLTPRDIMLDEPEDFEDGDYGNVKTYKCFQQLLSIAYNPDGRTIVTGASDGSILLWDIVKGKRRGANFSGHSDAILCLAYNPKGDMIASGSADETAILWDARTGRQLREPFLGHSDRVWSVSFSPDGQTLITGGGDAMIILWETRTGQPKGYPLEGHTDWIGRVIFSPDGASIASGGGDKTVRLWDTASGEQKLELSAHTDFVYTLAFSPDGLLLATGSRDKTICMWNPYKGNFVMPPLLGHSEAVLNLTFLKNSAGLFLVSGSYDCTVNVWNSVDGSLVHSFKGHKKAVVSVCCAPDGAAIASASLDTTMKYWNLTAVMDIAATSMMDGTDDNTIRDDLTYTDFGSEDDFMSDVTDMDGKDFGDNESLSKFHVDSYGQEKHRNALRIGGFVGIAMQRFARAGTERAKRRQNELMGGRARTPSLQAVAESSNEGQESTSEIATESEAARDVNEIRVAAKQKIKAGLLAIKAGQKSIALIKGTQPEGESTQTPQNEVLKSKQEENRKAAMLWFNCALQAGLANDLLPASQLAEVGIALCETDRQVYQKEWMLLTELQGLLRRAVARSKDPAEWSTDDVLDFIRLSAGNLGIELSEPVDGKRLVQNASELLAVWTGLNDASVLKRIKNQLTALVLSAAEARRNTGQDGMPQADASGSSEGSQGVDVCYEVIVGSTTFEIFPDDPAAPKLGTLNDIKRAIVEHIGDPDILGPNDDFKLVRVDTQTGRDMAMGHNTRAVELMITQGRRPVFKVSDVKPRPK